MKVRFYDVGQALAALVELPTGQLVLVDTGQSPARAGCGQPCRDWHDHLMAELAADVGNRDIALLWVTHPHSDHVGGAKAVLDQFTVRTYVDNGSLRANTTVTNTLATAAARGTKIILSAADVPTKELGLQNVASLSVRGIVPSPWPVDCDKKPNDCSAALRIDYCASSVLFVGDAELHEEVVLGPTPATVLQVGHHGSDTSSSSSFLQAVKPTYAVISAGKRDEGTNRTYCHPRASTVATLSMVLGDTSGARVDAFDGTKCANAPATDWKATAGSTNLYVTARDGDVVLVTTGDGKFVREANQ